MTLWHSGDARVGRLYGCGYYHLCNVLPFSNKINSYTMTEKFNNKYRIPSARLSGWDYGADAIYFVTIYTNDRQHYFGKIEDDTMQLNTAGMIAQQCVGWIFQHISLM